MADYDPTNRGAAWLTTGTVEGTLNVAGVDHTIVSIKRNKREGKQPSHTVIVATREAAYMGAMWPPKKSDAKHVAGGKVTINGDEYMLLMYDNSEKHAENSNRPIVNFKLLPSDGQGSSQASAGEENQSSSKPAVGNEFGSADNSEVPF
jgi:hypothetical protein